MKRWLISINGAQSKTIQHHGGIDHETGINIRSDNYGLSLICWMRRI